eukprot:GHVL01033696.1.p1 GENE.GHVL01033696.1~~GHVL01033696.1.p1  ORF type:complete len:710 (+),score=102.37 GHVL01033696.1:170-2299(+)
MTAFLPSILSVLLLSCLSYRIHVKQSPFKICRKIKLYSLDSINETNPLMMDEKETRHLSEWLTDMTEHQSKVMNGMLDAVKTIDKEVREAECFDGECYGNSKKWFSETDLDQVAASIVVEELAKKCSELIAQISIAGTEKVTPFEGTEFSIAVDSLSGYMQLSDDLPVATTFAIWTNQQLDGLTGRDIFAAGSVIYGPRTKLSFATRDMLGVHEFILGGDGQFVHERTINKLQEGDIVIAPYQGELRGINNFYDVHKEFFHRIGGKCPVADSNTVLTNQGGMYANPVSIDLVHSAIPMAYLIEKAGGAAINGLSDILDSSIERKTEPVTAQFVAGNRSQVDSYKSLVGPTQGVDSMTRRVETTPKSSSQENHSKKITLVFPRGFCEGVVRAVDTVEQALQLWGSPIYVKHEIVHNKIVCDRLKDKGAVFVEDLKDVPEGSKIVYSAHGIPPEVREEAANRQLLEIDATCPLVTKVHVYVKRKAKEGYKILLIGHRNHVEVKGTYGEAPDVTTVVETVEDVDRLSFTENDKLFYTSQTTLSMDDCKDIVERILERYPKIETIPSGSICYATTNRQEALRNVVNQADLTLVVGDIQSSNSKRLVEASKTRGVNGYLVMDPNEINPEWIKSANNIIVTSGASTPEDLVLSVVDRLRTLGVDEIDEFTFAEEHVNWRLPKPIEDARKGYKEKHGVEFQQHSHSSSRPQMKNST